MAPPKKKKLPKTPENVARQNIEETKNPKQFGAASMPHGITYTKKGYLKDKEINRTVDPDAEPKTHNSPKTQSIHIWAQRLLEYSKKESSIDICRFLMLYEMPPKTFYDLLDRHEELALAYSQATNNFAANALSKLDGKNTLAAANVATRIYTIASPFMKRARKEARIEEERIKLSVLQEIAEIRKQLAQDIAAKPQVVYVRDTLDAILEEE